MKKTLKMMSFFAMAVCATMIGLSAAKADTFKIDVINGQDGTGTNYGTITTIAGSGTHTTDADTNGIITIASGKERFVEVDMGTTQVFKVTVEPGYEIESVLMDRQYVEISADGTYTFPDIQADHALCVKYKKIGAPTSPNTGDVAYVLPVAAVALVSFGLIIVIARKRRNVKA